MNVRAEPGSPRAADAARRGRWHANARVRDAVDGYLFIAPAVLIIGIFVLGAAVYALYLSFTNYTGLSAPSFVGLHNYVTTFRDAIALQSFVNTLIFTGVTIPANVVLALGVGLILNRRFVGIRFLRTAYFIPVVVSTVVAVSVFKAMYDFRYGVFNAILGLVGIAPIGWYADQHYAMLSVIVLSLWKSVSFNSIIFLAALQDTPDDLIDAAKVDGANALRRFGHVILPHLRPVVTFILILSAIGGFRIFTEPYVLTQGGPANATRTIMLYVYNSAFSYNQMGYAAALSFVLLVIILVLSLILLYLSESEAA